MNTAKPTVLFVCVHNAGRSQMAAGWLEHLAGQRVEVRSAGSEPAEQINPVAVEAMNEVGIDITSARPKILTVDAVRDSDVVITMGCGDTCPIFPGKRYEDWELEDPAGQGIETVRRVRDEIRERIQALVDELLPAQAAYIRRQAALAAASERLSGLAPVDADERQAVLDAIDVAHSERAEQISAELDR